jgi:DNA repair protein RecO (recombination protein O)
MHEKYTTRGCIVGAAAYREADKIISIYTEDFGLVSAVATGVRKAESKLRFHAQDYSVRYFSLVQGRDLWRFVGAEEISGLDKITGAEKLALYARVLSLIRRLIRGEEENRAVFATLFGLYKILAGDAAQIADADLTALETLAVFRILHDLGYVKSDTSTAPLITPGEITVELIAAARPLTSSLINSINSGLTESHL